MLQGCTRVIAGRLGVDTESVEEVDGQIVESIFGELHFKRFFLQTLHFIAKLDFVFFRGRVVRMLPRAEQLVHEHAARPHVHFLRVTDFGDLLRCHIEEGACTFTN